MRVVPSAKQPNTDRMGTRSGEWVTSISIPRIGFEPRTRIVLAAASMVRSAPISIMMSTILFSGWMLVISRFCRVMSEPGVMAAATMGTEATQKSPGMVRLAGL